MLRESSSLQIGCFAMLAPSPAQQKSACFISELGFLEVIIRWLVVGKNKEQVFQTWWSSSLVLIIVILACGLCQPMFKLSEKSLKAGSHSFNKLRIPIVYLLRLEPTSTLFISRDFYKEYSFLRHFFSFHYPKAGRMGTVKVMKIGEIGKKAQLCFTFKKKNLIPSHRIPWLA